MEPIHSKLHCTLIFLIAVMLLPACTSKQVDVHVQSEMHMYSSPNVNYSFAVPKGYAHETDDEEGMYFGYADTSKFGQVTVQSYDNQKLNKELESSCSPSITGASRLTNTLLDTDNAAWGRVDAYDIMGENVAETVLCQPLELSWTVENGKSTLLSSAYAFCAEKDEKTVVICIGQMKDDPSLAKQIFETFRWTE